METLRLKPRQPVEEQIESWDDGDFDIIEDDLTFRSSSSNQQNAPSSRRDSQGSVMSMRSELESVQGEERHVHLPGDDEKSTTDAIAAATKAGIPIPQNAPSSALMGGTIKRLGGRKIKKSIQDDWENDLELPEAAQPLRIKPQDASQFPDQLRQVSDSQTSPIKKASRLSALPPIIKDERRESTNSISSVMSGATNLEKFRDNDEDDDFFGDGSATIKVSKTRQARPISLITPPTPQKNDKASHQDDDFENDFELPSDGKLKLSTKKNIPKTPSSQADDLDWGEGSLGTRFGGTRRDGRSNRSSSASALSPSVSSSFTAESEDDTFDGLVLPSGPVNFEDRLKKQRKSRSPVRSIEEEPLDPKTPQTATDKEDFLSGLDIGDGEVFDPGKLTLHRNIHVNSNRPPSPARPKTSVSLTFGNKAASSRLPRPSHERAHSSLEPVSESGGPIPKSRKSQSRPGHSAQSSVSSVHTPTTPSPLPSQLSQPATPRRREIVNRTSTTSLRTGNEPTTTSSQLLKFKRSLPAMKASQSPGKPPAPRYERPSSRTDNNRPLSGLRPKTPVDRSRPTADGSQSQPRKPFMPAGPSVQTHQVVAKASRTFRRHDSDNSIDLRPTSRRFSGTTMRSPSPQRLQRSAQQIAQSGVRGEYYQMKSKKFGDGHELDAFDDLPTSAHTESTYTRQPTKAPLRNKIYQNVQPDRTNTPSPGPHSPAKVDHLPHFARDTAASRIARETSLAQRVPSTGPPAPLSSQRVAQLSSRSNFNPGVPQSTVRSKKHRKQPQLKPYLITNMNKDQSAKHENGMFYNPQTHRWEGNDNALNAFDVPASSPSTASLPSHMAREKENSTPRPALITNITGTKGVQVVGGMVFDPQSMCWLKLGPQANPKSETSDPMDGFDGLNDDDDDDVFKDIPDLEEPQADANEGGHGRVSDIQDDWLVGEEFDVGPEFVRRQREEEDRWRKKCEKWLDLGGRERDRDAWRWTIRDLLGFQRAAQ